MRKQVVDLAVEQPDLASQELAVRFTDSRRYFVSEASVYRVLKAHDLITSPAFIVIKAADELREKPTRPNQLWQTDFTYLMVICWGLVLPLDDPRRLQPLRHRPAALRHDERVGRDRHLGRCPGRLKL